MSVAVTETVSSAGLTSAYIAVQPEVLRHIGTAAVDVFLPHDPHSAPVLYRQAGYPVEPEQLAELQAAGVQLYVRTDDFHLLGAELLESLESFIQRDSIPCAERYAALQVAVGFEIEHALRLIDCRRFLSVAERIGRNLTALLATGNVVPRELFGIARHDFYTFTHVTNTACYSLLLAERLGLYDDNELQQIATGAALHDIGKRFIPANVLAKTGSLTQPERELIETHPQRATP